MEDIQSAGIAREAVVRTEKLVRFGVLARLEHLVLMISFIVLALTGLAEKYYQSATGAWLIAHLGGIEATRWMHHLFAFVFIGVAVFHLGFMVYHLAVRKGQPTMVPTLKDARDAIGYLRYCIGLTDRKPQFGRYDYRQKFEYWGIIFGGLIMLLSGATLMWPVIVTRFLPGGVVPAAQEFHSNEALLALLTIVVWHFYSALFRPGTFPGDFTMFTGKISPERMLEEHPLEYRELTLRLEKEKEKAGGRTMA